MSEWSRIFKYAVVDIGANSVRMHVYDITQTGAFSVSASARSMLGLAAYAQDGMLTPDGCGKLYAVLREFLARANSIPCDGFSAFATASLRGLSNSDKILREIKDRLGIDVEIISGETEASYDFAAIRYRFPSATHGILIDMGGGSTEIVRFDGEIVLHAVSLPIGCVMLMKRFTACTKKNPFPTETEIAAIRAYVRETLAGYPMFTNVGGEAYLIGGTARAAAKLRAAAEGLPAPSDGDAFSSEDMKKTADAAFCDIRLGGNRIREIVPDRITSVIPGLAAYREIADYTGVSRFVLSTAGVREGYMIDYIMKNFPQKFQEF